MRFLKFSSLAVLAFAAAACQTDDGGAKATSVPPLAYVRYINAVPDSLIVTINAIRNLPATPDTTDRDTTFTLVNHTSTLRFTDYLEFTPMSWANVAFRGIGQGGYQGVKAGTRDFKIFTYDPSFFTTFERADTSFTFVAGSYYTIVHWKDGTAAAQVRIITDAPPAANAQFQYKVMNLGQGLGAIDAYQTADSTTAIAGAATLSNIPELGSSAYINTALVATQAVQMTPTGLTTRLAGPRAPAGGVAGSGLELAAGTNVAGSVMTAFLFPAQPSVSFFNRTWRPSTAVALTTPFVAWYIDIPPTTIAP